MVVSTFAGRYFKANVLLEKTYVALEEWNQNVMFDEWCKAIAGISSMAGMACTITSNNLQPNNAL